jgi:formylglycine-generating enzyme required for sulfatase activity
VEYPVSPSVSREHITNSIGMKLVLIPTGEFTMGSPNAESAHQPHEGPQHKVRITRPFYMGIFEVTRGQYEKVMGKNPSTNKESRDHPVEEVSPGEAAEFCKRLSALPEEESAGRVYRLPTEAEWEYACRAGTTTAFHWGNLLSSKAANSLDSGIGKTVKVGSYPPNAWGLYDMHGNVWEWCIDGPRTYTTAPVDAPRGPVTPRGSHVLRGGSYLDAAAACRSASRNPREPSLHGANVGFRVVYE